MNRSNALLWFLVILFAGFAFWMIFTGKFSMVTNLFINGIWKSIENMIRPIFHR